jgi:hypothetical protein
VQEQLVITFQSIMFVSLGFLAAVLLGFIIAPAFWERAVRLTTERMRASLPLTEREIKAEYSRLRAENAIRIHRLSAERDKAKMVEARQTIEVNRRDAAIADLERRLNRVQTENEASENARRVLEATLKERMPELETRLVEARQLLAHRDSEMKALRDDASKTFRALDEAMQANAQQRSEIGRLKTSLAAQSGRPASPPEGAETEQALRSELEGLRVRTRDQADLIKRLQKMMKAGEGRDDAKPADSLTWQEEKRLAELTAVQEGLEASREALLAQVRTLSEKVEAQASEISALKRELSDAEAAGSGGAWKRGRAGDKAVLGQRIAAKDDEIADRDKTIAGLRRELATANERLAKQAAYYMDELRRLGPGGTGRTGNSVMAASQRTAVAAVADVDAGTATGAEPAPDEAVGGEAGLETRLKDSENRFGVADAASDAPPQVAARPKLVERIASLAKR